jgi:hypothetical protein
MSHDSRINGNEGNNAVVAYRRNVHFGSTVKYTSSIVINIRQLRTDLHTQHQHEKEALTGLNQRFRLFVDHVHQLESKNKSYLTELANARRQSSGVHTIDTQSYERYLSVKANLAKGRNANVDYEFDFEWFQLQCGIYQQLIDEDQQWKDQRCMKLEQELKQLTSDSIIIRKSYADLESVVKSQYVERKNMFNQYLALTHDWVNVRKQRKKWHLSVEGLKHYIGFYKNVRSHSVQ